MVLFWFFKAPLPLLHSFLKQARLQTQTSCSRTSWSLQKRARSHLFCSLTQKSSPFSSPLASRADVAHLNETEPPSSVPKPPTHLQPLMP